MTHRDSMEAVMQALQRQQREAYEREPIPAEPIIEVARAFLLRSPTQNARIGGYGQLAPADDSLIKARYASTILRVAQTSDRDAAARLVDSIAGDLPLQSELPEVADIHLRAIASFVQLATSLRDKTNPKQQPPWKTALDAAADWLRKVEMLAQLPIPSGVPQSRFGGMMEDVSAHHHPTVR
jgi:hypothetical protein